MNVLCCPGRKSVFGVPAPLHLPSLCQLSPAAGVQLRGYFLREALQLLLGWEPLVTASAGSVSTGSGAEPGLALHNLWDPDKTKMWRPLFKN